MSGFEEKFPSKLVEDIDHQGIGHCEGYEKEITMLMGRLSDKDLILNETVRDQMQHRIDLLSDALDNRNRRIDNTGGPMWLGMKGR